MLAARHDYISINSSAQLGCDTKFIFTWCLTGLNSPFSFSYIICHNKIKEPSLSYYIPITGKKAVGFLPSPNVFTLCEK